MCLVRSSTVIPRTAQHRRAAGGVGRGAGFSNTSTLKMTSAAFSTNAAKADASRAVNRTKLARL